MAHRDFSGRSDSITLPQGIERAPRFEELPSSSPSNQSSGSPAKPGTTSSGYSEIVRKALSVHSIISTDSDVARRITIAVSAPPKDEDLRIIGQGTCGTIFEIPGTETAYKRGTDTKALWRDFLLTNSVHRALMSCRPHLELHFNGRMVPLTPECHEFALPDAGFWEQNGHRFPKGHQDPKTAFSVDRILPIPRPARNGLIDRYFDDDDLERAKNEPENADCLVRVYLGEEETEEQQKRAFTSLRNFELRLNMIEELGLDAEEYAIEMALGLAVVHWGAQVDGMDMEFVIGGGALRPPNHLLHSLRKNRQFRASRRHTA
jgi:hypothetical protein